MREVIEERAERSSAERVEEGFMASGQGDEGCWVFSEAIANVATLVHSTRVVMFKC